MALLETLRTHYQNHNRDEAKSAVAEASGITGLSASEIERCAAVAKHYVDFENAAGCFQLLVKQHPENLHYRNLLAETLTQIGDFDGAKAELCEALTLDSAHARSYFNLSLIHKAAADDPDIRAVTDMLHKGVDQPNDQYVLRLALAKWLDDIDDYDGAFAQIDAAKKSAPIEYDHEAQAAFFDRIKTTFTKSFCSDNAGGGDPSQAPMFIIGMPRSGTSLLETMLASQKGVTALGERIEMSLTTQKIAEDHNALNGYLGAMGKLTGDDFKKYGRDYCDAISSISPGGTRLIDKNMLNFQRAALIDLLLPKSLMIHVKRNPLDTCLSCYFQTLDPASFPFIFNLENLGRYYLLYADLMEYWREVLPGRIEEIDYEDVVGGGPALDALCKRAGLETPDGNTAAADNTVATASVWQARQPVNELSVNRWKNYERHLSPLIAVLEAGGIKAS